MTTKPVLPVSLLQALSDVQTVLRAEGLNLEIGSRKLLKEIAQAIEAAIAAAQADTPRTRVLTEHSGCGQGTQVDQLTVRLNPGDKVVLVMGRYSAAIAADRGSAA